MPTKCTYQSYTTVVELLSSISEILKENILSSFQASKYYSIMADKSTDSASQEELSVCARWLHATAELISDHLITFLKSSDISLEKMRGLGFDGASNMSGHRSGVQRRLKVHAPLSYLYSL